MSRCPCPVAIAILFLAATAPKPSLRASAAASTAAFLPSLAAQHSTRPLRQHELDPFIANSRLRRWKRFGERNPSHVQLSVSSDTSLQHDEIVVSSMEQVHQCIQHNDTSSLVVEGRVTAKRSFGPSFGFIDVVTTDTRNDDSNTKSHHPLVQLMVKRQDYRGELGSIIKGINVGMNIRVVGVASPTRNPGEGVVLVHSFQIVTLPPNPQHVRTLLRLCSQDKLDTTQLSLAANITVEELNMRINSSAGNDESKDFDSLAKDLLSWSSLSPERQKSHDETPSHVTPHLFPEVPPSLCNPPLSHADIQPSNSTTVSSTTSISRLHARFQEQSQERGGETVTLQAWVQNRRRFQDSVTVLKVNDAFVAVSNNDKDADGGRDSTRLQTVLHPAMLGRDAADVYGSLLCAGSRVVLQGHVVVASQSIHSASLPLTLWVTHLQLLRCSWRPMAVMHLIELTVRNEFPVAEAANALNMDSHQVGVLSKLNLTERQWRASEISQSLQSSQTRTASVSKNMVHVLESLDGLRRSYPALPEEPTSAPTPAEQGIDGNNDVSLATNVPGTWWQRKKRPQLEFMGRQIESVVRSHPDFGARKLQILDVGGGKGVLANYLAQLLGDVVAVQVVDIAAGAIKNGMMRSKRLATSVKYFAGDASLFRKDNVDVVVALHACGALSDVALGHAVNHGAAFVVCPCCFRSNPHLRVPVVDQDGRTRQFLSPYDWLEVDEKEFGIITRIAEIQGDAKLASKAMHTVCAMRAAAIHRLAEDERRREPFAGRTVNVRIKTFPVSFSTCNFCLVGAVERAGPRLLV